MTLVVGLVLDGLVLMTMTGVALFLATRERPRRAAAGVVGVAAGWHLFRRLIEDLIYEGPYPLVLFMLDNDLLDWLQLVLPTLSAVFTFAELVEWGLLVAAVFVGRPRSEP